MITPGLSDVVWQSAQANRVKCHQQNVSAWFGYLRVLKAAAPSSQLRDEIWMFMRCDVIIWLCLEERQQTFGFSPFSNEWTYLDIPPNVLVNNTLASIVAFQHVEITLQNNTTVIYSIFSSPARYRPVDMLCIIDFSKHILPCASISHVDCP